MTYHTIKPWDIQYLDSFTLNKIFNIVSELELKNYNEHIKTDYDKGKGMAYRTVMGELSSLIEHKKTIDKINKEARKKGESLL